MEQVKTFQNDLSLQDNLDEAINAWLKEAGVEVVSVHRDVFKRDNHIGIHQHRFGVLTTVVYREKE